MRKKFLFTIIDVKTKSPAGVPRGFLFVSKNRHPEVRAKRASKDIIEAVTLRRPRSLSSGRPLRPEPVGGHLMVTMSLRRLRRRVLAEFRQDLLREEPHRLALPFAIRAAPVESGHQQSAKRAGLVAQRDEAVEKRFRRTVEH